MSDGIDKLAQALYQRKASAREWLGGANAKILTDAAAKITVLQETLRFYADGDNDDGEVARETLREGK